MLNTFSEIQLTYKPVFLASNQRVNNLQDMHQFIRQLFNPDQLTIKEECVAVFLNRANKVIGTYQVSSWGITGTVVDIRLVLSVALKTLCSGIVIAHTHPSGNINPSKEDLALTLKLKEAAKLMDIALLDHFILTADSYYSFAADGCL